MRQAPLMERAGCRMQAAAAAMTKQQLMRGDGRGFSPWQAMGAVIASELVLHTIRIDL